jgi:predicted 2-oxoglutarate/Fe(II)-dependent dioxygenase YbiX
MLLDFIKKYYIPEPILTNLNFIVKKEENWAKHSWYEPLTRTTSEEGCSVTHSINCSELINFVSDCILNYISFFPASSSPSFSAIRCNKYSKNEGMHSHVDNIFSLFEGNNRGVPILSVVGLIDSSHEGGDFFFNLKNEGRFQFLKNKGDMIIFPSFFGFEHEVTPVVSGVLYSFVSWTYG